MPADRERISYDTGASGTVQGDIGRIVGNLETLISTRQGQVNRAMADFQADGVSQDYHGVEMRWNRASNEVRAIVNLVKTTLGLNDETARGTQQRAQQSVQNIG